MPGLTIEQYRTLAMGGMGCEVVGILLQLVQVDNSGAVGQFFLDACVSFVVISCICREVFSLCTHICDYICGVIYSCYCPSVL